MLPPGLMQGQRVSAEDRRLLRRFRELDAASRQTLLAFADFLAERGSGAAAHTAAEALPEPIPEPRPAAESVIAAIRRLRRSYPMLDSGTMLRETSELMAAHVLQGREAVAVIDELELLFAARFEALKAESDRGGND